MVDAGDGFDLAELARRIAGAPSVLLTEFETLERIGLNGQGDAALATLLDEDYLQVWDRDDGPMLLLTTRAANALNLECEDDGRGGSRWVAKGTSVDHGPCQNGRTRPETDAFHPDGPGLDDRADPSQREPWEIVADAEQPAPRPRQGSARKVPKPAIIRLGERAWHTPDPEQPCQVCGSMPLPARHYCASCDSFGLEDMLEPVLKSERPRPYVWTEGPYAGGTGEAEGLTGPALESLMAEVARDAAERAKLAKEKAKATRARNKAKREKAMGFRPRKSG